LAEALLRTLQGPQVRTKLGAAARQRVVDSFSLEAVLRQYASLYEKLLAGRR
jgi:glycosyltransferase involved in cell wall biosynthesis